MVIPNAKVFFWIRDAAAVNPNCIKTFLTNVLSTFFIKGKPDFCNGPKNLPENCPDCPIVCNWIFDDFIIVEEPFAKPLRSLETFVLVNNNLCRKLYSLLELPITFDERFKLTSVPFLFMTLIY